MAAIYTTVDDAFWRNHAEHRLARLREPLYGGVESVVLLIPYFLGLIAFLNFLPGWVGA